MTGPQHYQEAERLLSIAGDTPDAQAALHAEAQVHATLALTAATVQDAVSIDGQDADRWAEVTA